MNETLRNITVTLSVAVAVAATVAAVSAITAAVVAASVVAAAVAAVTVAAAMTAWVVGVFIENPKTSIAFSTFIIVVSFVSMFFVIPIAMHHPQMVEVVCQTAQNSTQIFIHQSVTQTITIHSLINQTYTENVAQVGCP